MPETPPAGEVVINEVKLVDTLVEWFAWGWMCVGVVAVLAVLITFPLLQIRGAYLRRNQDS